MSTVVPEPDKRALGSLVRPLEGGRLAALPESEEIMVVHISFWA